MRRIATFLAFAAASGAGAGAVYFVEPQRNRELQVAELSRNVSSVSIQAERPGDVETRTFSPQQPLFSRVVGQAWMGTVVRDTTTGFTATVDRAAGPLMKPKQLRAAPTGVTSEPAERTAPSHVETKRTLVRDIQRELKRVGCYAGEINGVWNANAKRAMKQFTERVNARLPLEEPNYILLTLVLGHGINGCGKLCASGQAMIDDARCQPSGLLAKAGTGAPATPVVRAAAADAGMPELQDPPAERARRREAEATAGERVAAVPATFVGIVPPVPNTESPPQPLADRSAAGPLLAGDSGSPNESGNGKIKAAVNDTFRSPPPRYVPPPRDYGGYGGRAAVRSAPSKHWTKTIFNDMTQTR